MSWQVECLAAEPVEGAALAFERVDDVERGHGLPLGVLGVGNSIPDHALQVVLENTSGLLVDQSADTLDTTSSSQSPDCGLSDALDVVS